MEFQDNRACALVSDLPNNDSDWPVSMYQGQIFEENLFLQRFSPAGLREYTWCATHYVNGGEFTDSCKIPLQESKWIFAGCRKLLPLCTEWNMVVTLRLVLRLNAPRTIPRCVNPWHTGGWSVVGLDSAHIWAPSQGPCRKIVRTVMESVYFTIRRWSLSRLEKNANFPWNIVKKFLQNVNYFTNFRIFCKKKTKISMI